MTVEISVGDVLAELDKAVLCTEDIFQDIVEDQSHDYASGLLDGMRAFRNYLRSEQFRRSIIAKRRTKCL